MLICPEASSAQNNIAAQRAAKLIYICRTPRERERQTLGTGADVQPLSGRWSGRELGWAGPRTVLHPAAAAWLLDQMHCLRQGASASRVRRLDHLGGLRGRATQARARRSPGRGPKLFQENIP